MTITRRINPPHKFPWRRRWQKSGSDAILAITLVFAGCSLQQPPAPGPANPRISEAASKIGTRDASAQKPPAIVVLDLLQPTIAHPELAEVRSAIEHGDDSQALELCEQALVHLNPPMLDRMRWHLWLAYAYQKRNDCGRALTHFDAASATPWPLIEYSRFGAAQCRLALGNLQDALGMLDVSKTETPLEESVNLLRAQIASQTGHFGQAIEIWRDYLQNHGGVSLERSSVSLSLAQTLYSTTAIDVYSGLQVSQPPVSGSTEAILKEALSLLDSIAIRDFEISAQQRVFALKEAIVAALFSSDPGQQQQCKIRDQVDELEILVEQRDFIKAQSLAASLLVELEMAGLKQSVSGCRALYASGQAHAGKGELTEALAQFETIIRSCNEPEDIVARSIFAVARHWQDLHDEPAAIAKYELLERRFPTSRLADDARLRQAYAYLELGSESKFTDLIMRMAEDFPEGDMVAEGLFQLALRHMTKGDWSGAVSLLWQLGRVPRVANREDVEQSERQVYFLARAQYQNGQRDIAVDELEQLVSERPFSYYMLQAYSRLMQWDPDRASRAKQTATTQNVDAPFSVPYQPQFDRPGYFRAMELMALGEIDRGTEELKLLHLPQDVEPLLLWIKASFEATAGSLKNSQKLVRDRLRDWPRRWPIGAWEPAWKVAFPQPYLDIVVRESKRTRVPKSLVYAVMREESQFDHNAISGAEAYGLMQLIVPTARIAAKKLGMTVDVKSLKRPSVNVALGCQVLSNLLQRFNQQPILAIPGYNAGPGRPTHWLKDRPDMDFDVWVEAIPIAETRTYFKHVLSSWATYAWLYERDTSEATMKLPLKMGN